MTKQEGNDTNYNVVKDRGRQGVSRMVLSVRNVLGLATACVIASGALIYTRCANADTVTVMFIAQQGGSLSHSPTATLTLLSDGLILGEISAPAGQTLIAGGFQDDLNAMDPEYNFSAGNVTGLTAETPYGTFNESFAVTGSDSAGPSIVSFFIGVPGEFNSVVQAFGPNASGFGAFVQTFSSSAPTPIYAGRLQEVPVPLPESFPLLMSALSSLAVVARCRIQRP